MYSKALLHLLFLWMSIPLLAQNPCWGPNLVPNPSFEGYYSCPENKSIQRSITGWDDFSINMAQFPPSMDYFNLDCKKKVGLYAEIPQDNPPRTGTGMLGGFQFRFQAYTVIWDTTGRLLKEYAYCKLSAPLQVGKTYHLQFYTKYAISRQFRNGSIDQIGAVLSENNPLNFFANSKYRGPAPIAQRSAGQHLKDSSTWVPVSRTFVADKPYIYLTLGHFYDYDLATIQNFFKGTNSYNAYYLFDDAGSDRARAMGKYCGGSSLQLSGYRALCQKTGLPRGIDYASGVQPLSRYNPYQQSDLHRCGYGGVHQAFAYPLGLRQHRDPQGKLPSSSSVS
jgi:hypothetical protein